MRWSPRPNTFTKLCPEPNAPDCAPTRLLPGTELSDRVVTYEQQILSEQLPESIVIAGAGAIGVEFAYVLHNYGVKVTIVEYLDRMVPLEDEEVSVELAKRFSTDDSGRFVNGVLAAIARVARPAK